MSPPRLAEHLIGWTLPADRRREVLHDLRELFAHRQRERGRVAALRWYWKQVGIFAFRSRSLRSSESSRSDILYALRGLARAPGFAIVAIVTLALGIGANVAIWSVVHHVVLRPLGYADEDRLVRVWPEHHFTRERFETFRDRTSSFESFSAAAGESFTLSGDGPPAAVRGLSVSAAHFEAFGLAPALGRVFESRDQLPGAEPVAIVSHRMWQERFGGLSDVVGKRIELEKRRTIVGVAPVGFRPFGGENDIWVPITFDPDAETYTHVANLRVVARLKPGVDHEGARAELEAIASGLDPPIYALDEVPTYTVAPFRDVLVGRARPMLFVLLGAVSVVLLLCCVNVTNLLLARGMARERELSIRYAMGASRFRIVRLLLTENTVLGFLAGALGFTLAWLGSAELAAFVPAELPRSTDVAVDVEVALITAGLSLAATILFGLVPALRASARPASLATRGASPGRSRFRINEGLVAAEIALSLALVAASGLLLKSFWRLQQAETGFRADTVLSMRLSPPPLRYGEQARKLQYYGEVIEALHAVPGVASVGAIQILPMTPSMMGVGYSPTGAPLPPGVAPPIASYRIVTPGYRETLGVPLLQGRDLDERDRAGEPSVGLVNETLAQELWPGESAIGRELKFDDGSVWFTIVGIIGNVHQHRLELAPDPEVYVPLAQDSWPPSMHLLVRAASDPVSLAPSVRAAVWSVDKDVPISQSRSMDEVVRISMSDPRLRTSLFAGFALIAFVLSAVGVYGVTSYTVRQHTHDIGIRMALGASARRVLGETLVVGMRPVLAGLAFGLIASLLATKALSSFLYQVEATDPVVYAAVSFLLGGVALSAAYLPARRASKADPLDVLNVEG